MVNTIGGFILGLLVMLLIVTSLNVFDETFEDYLSAFQNLAVGASALGALYVYATTPREDASKFKYQRATETLLGFERLVRDSLMEANNGRGQIPRNERLIWLMFEQQIVVVTEYKKDMLPHHLDDLRLREMEVRRSVADYFDDDPGGVPRFGPDYFAEAPDRYHIYSSGVRMPVSESSVATIYLWIRGRASFKSDESESFEDLVHSGQHKRLELTEAEVERLSLFGPIGFARFMERLLEWERDHNFTRRGSPV